MSDPGYLSNAELANKVHELVEMVRAFKNQQVDVYTTDANFASVTDGIGNPHLIPSWKAVQSAGSEAEANADLAGASVYRKQPLVSNGTTLTIDTSLPASYFEVTLNTPAVALVLPAPEVEETHMKQITLGLIQGTGANTVTWPNNVTWPHRRMPVLSYEQAQADMVTLLYVGGGKWRGFFAAGGFA